MSDFVIDPEFRDLIPPLTAEEFGMLRDDINKYGCRDKLIVWLEGNILLDGHNRADICSTLDLPYQVDAVSFKSRTDAMLWMIRHQLARRNLSDAARVALNLKLKPVLAAKAKENLKLSPGAPVKGSHNCADLSAEPTEAIDTRAEIAKASDVSHETVRRVEKVLAEAPAPVQKKMLSGEMSVNEAFKATQPAKPKEELLPPMTEKQEQSWGALSSDVCERVRAYAKRCPAAKSKIISDLRDLIRSL